MGKYIFLMISLMIVLNSPKSFAFPWTKRFEIVSGPELNDKIKWDRRDQTRSDQFVGADFTFHKVDCSASKPNKCDVNFNELFGLLVKYSNDEYESLGEKHLA